MGVQVEEGGWDASDTFSQNHKVQAMQDTYCFVSMYLFSANRTQSTVITVLQYRQSDTYLHIVIAKVFDSNAVPFKWNPVQLLHHKLVLMQDVAECRYTDMVYIMECCVICDNLLS